MSGRLYISVRDEKDQLTYIFPEKDTSATYWAANGFGSFYILMNSFIPLSLVVTLEISKLWYAKFIEEDVDMISIDYDSTEINQCRV